MISVSAFRKSSICSSVVKAPGLSRIVPSGNVPEVAVDVRGAVQARPDGDVEAGVEDRAEVLGRQPVGDDQRERPDVGGRVPAPGDLPAVGALDPVDDASEQIDLVPPEGFRARAP